MRSFLIALLLATALPAQAQFATVMPRDEAATDPSFVVFRGRLIEALAARDTSAVLAAFAPDAKLSFGADESGPEGVRELWLSGQYEGMPDLFTELARVVGMGSVADGGFVTAPYTFAGLEGEYDPFETGIVVGENVNVRAEPSRGSEVLTALSYAAVEVAEWGYPERPGDEAWHRVRLADGREGFVAAPYLWSIVDYRAGFVKTDRRWQIGFFLAGD